MMILVTKNFMSTYLEGSLVRSIQTDIDADEDVDMMMMHPGRNGEVRGTCLQLQGFDKRAGQLFSRDMISGAQSLYNNNFKPNPVFFMRFR